MRTFLAGALVLAATAVPAGAEPPAAGLSSPNLAYVATIPVDAGLATGARLVGRHLYVGGSKSFSIYDVADPALPKLLSVTPVGLNFPSEDVDTDGRILLVNDEQLASGELQVWDVRDKALPKKLASLPDMRDHTFTCVLGCTWAYGSRGSIVDLRDPARPRLAGRWGTLPRSDGFDVTEVAPGIVLTSTRTMRLLDARRNPARPVVLRTGGTPDNRLIHSNRWPRAGKDRFFLVQGETPFTQRCTASSGAIMAWDARTFRIAGEYRVANGTYVDGDPAAGAAGCTAMWFQQHPTFRDGGLVAAAFFEHGIRLLDVAGNGSISEAGWYMPAGGATIAAYWVSPEYLYAVDLERGIDILRYDATARRGRAPSRPPAPRRPDTRIAFDRPGRPGALWCQPLAASHTPW